MGRGADANAVNEEGDGPLHKATINNFVAIIGMLVAGNADVNIQVQTVIPPPCASPVAVHDSGGRLDGEGGRSVQMPLAA